MYFATRRKGSRNQDSAVRKPTSGQTLGNSRRLQYRDLLSVKIPVYLSERSHV